MRITRRQLSILAGRGEIGIIRDTPLTPGWSTPVHTGRAVIDPDHAFRIDVIGSRVMYLGELDKETAAFCGWPTVDGMAADLLAEKGIGWVAGFALRTLVAECGAETVHLVTLRRQDTERPRLLANFGKSGYVSSPAMAMPGEPEAVSADWTHEFGTAAHQARVAERATQQAELERLSLNERLDRAFRDARAAGLDTKLQEESILKRIKSLENRVRRTAVA